MLTKKYRLMRLLSLLVIYTFVIGLLYYLFNNLKYAENKTPYLNRDLPKLVMAGLIGSAIVCVFYFLLRLIPQIRNTAMLIGILTFVMTFFTLSAISMLGSLFVSFNPFTKENMLDYLIRFAPVLFIGYVDWFLTNRFEGISNT